MRSAWKNRLGVATLAAVLIVWAAPSARAQDDLVLNVAAGSESVTPGDTVTLTLDVANLSVPINGVQALIWYDDTVLALTSIVPTVLPLTPPNAGWVEVAFVDDFGDVTYAVVVNGDSVVADSTVATLTFTAIDEGVVPVTFRPGAGPFFTKLTVAADNSTIVPVTTNSANITSTCDDGVFCNGLETFDGLVCQPGTDPCAPLTCDEGSDTCFAPVHVDALELFYAGRFGTCAGGLDDGLSCSAANACRDDPGDPFDNPFCDLSVPQPDPSRYFLAAGALLFCIGGGNDGLACTENLDCAACVGSINEGQPCVDSGVCSGGACVHGACTSASLGNINNYARGITGIRVFFDDIVDFATTADAAFTYYWSDPPVCIGGTNNGLICNPAPTNPTIDPCIQGGGTCDPNIFSPVTDAGTAITVTPSDVGGVTVVDIVLADNHVRQRWLEVTVDSTQVSVGGVELDGELSGNPITFPSGDGTSGGDAVFYVGNMPGDVSGDRKARLQDVGVVRMQVNPALRVAIDNLYDVDKSVKVQLGDAGLVRLDVNPAFALPLISP